MVARSVRPLLPLFAFHDLNPDSRKRGAFVRLGWLEPADCPAEAFTADLHTGPGTRVRSVVLHNVNERTIYTHSTAVVVNVAKIAKPIEE